MADHDPTAAGWRSQHPQLTAKMVVDLVNGMEVVNDHLRCRSIPHPIAARLWRSITGRETREQYLIDVNLSTGMGVVEVWLKDLQAFQADSDLAIAAVASKLSETSNSLNEKFVGIREAISIALADANSRIEEVTRRVNVLDARGFADNHLKLTLQHFEWRSDPRRQPLLATTFFLTSQLWWGSFGTYCRLANDPREIKEKIEIASIDVGERVARIFGVHPRQMWAVDTLLKTLSNLSEVDRSILSYLTDRTAERAPLYRAIAEVIKEDGQVSVADRWLPRVFSPVGLSSRLFHESRLLWRSR